MGNHWDCVRSFLSRLYFQVQRADMPVFALPWALLTYLLQYESLKSFGTSLQQHLFASIIRWNSAFLNDRQSVVLQTMVYEKVNKNILATPKRLSSRNTYLQPVENELFRAVWIVKHPETQRSKVLMWFHGA